jgi:hypothetical protein
MSDDSLFNPQPRPAVESLDLITSSFPKITKLSKIGGSCVYLAFYAPTPEVIFVKGGKSDNPILRARSINTALPGGIDRMYASLLTNSIIAFDCERRLLNRLHSMDGTEPVGGEWFRINVSAIDETMRALREVGSSLVSIEDIAITPHKMRKDDKQENERMTSLAIVASANLERMNRYSKILVTQKLSKGHCGSYAGTLRG